MKKKTFLFGVTPPGRCYPVLRYSTLCMYVANSTFDRKLRLDYIKVRELLIILNSPIILPRFVFLLHYDEYWEEIAT